MANDERHPAVSLAMGVFFGLVIVLIALAVNVYREWSETK